MNSSNQDLDRIEVVFDEDSLVSDAGLLAASTLVSRLGLKDMIDETVCPPQSGRGSGAKTLTAVYAMLLGGSFFTDADRLRAGSAASVLNFKPVAPTTLGTFARSFEWTHVDQFDSAQEQALGRAWDAGVCRPGNTITVDIDSTICQVYGKAKEGAQRGYTKVLGFHPLVAVRNDTGEIVHARMREGGSQQGHAHFAEQSLLRMRRLSPNADLTLRADSGLFSWDLIDRLCENNTRFLIAISQYVNVKALVAAIPEKQWRTIGYTEDGEAQVAETTLTSARRRDKPTHTVRLVVRRSRPTDDRGQPCREWRHHALVTDIPHDELDTEAADAAYRNHARVELGIKDLKAGGLAHCPSGTLTANAAWLACAALAHNIARWVAFIGRPLKSAKLAVAATVALRLFAVPGRLVNRSGRLTLRLPSRWPWAAQFATTLRRIRNLPQQR